MKMDEVGRQADLRGMVAAISFGLRSLAALSIENMHERK